MRDWFARKLDQLLMSIAQRIADRITAPTPAAETPATHRIQWADPANAAQAMEHEAARWRTLLDRLR